MLPEDPVLLENPVLQVSQLNDSFSTHNILKAFRELSNRHRLAAEEVLIALTHASTAII